MVTNLTSSPRLTVSIISGLIVGRDAISNVCRQQVDALMHYAQSKQIHLDLMIFVQGTDICDPRIVICSDAYHVICHEHFQRSDLTIYHFGIYYVLFDSIHATPRKARVLVNYYGITSPGLLTGAARQACTKAYRQAINLHAADRILVNSKFVEKDAMAMGLPAARLGRLPLIPAARSTTQPSKVRSIPSVWQLVYLGRFVSAKGVHDLLDASKLFAAAGHPFQLYLLGNQQLSDHSYIARLQTTIVEAGLQKQVHLAFDLPDHLIAERLRMADVFVMPSHHEGFCIPVIEALGCGAFVISSDAGALPETCGGLGLLYPKGDAKSLFDRLTTFVAARNRGVLPTQEGEMPTDMWLSAVQKYLAQYTPEHFERHFLAAAVDGLTLSQSDFADACASSRCALFARNPTTQGPAPHPTTDLRLTQALDSGYKPKRPQLTHRCLPN